MTSPKHCGEPMDCVEYDADEDMYNFVCDECGHRFWVSGEDEVWK